MEVGRLVELAAEREFPGGSRGPIPPCRRPAPRASAAGRLSLSDPYWFLRNHEVLIERELRSLSCARQDPNVKFPQPAPWRNPGRDKKTTLQRSPRVRNELRLMVTHQDSCLGGFS